MNKPFLYFLLLVSLVFNGCKGNDNDTTTPVISLSEPTDNQVYTSGNVLRITGNLADNHLHEMKISITNNAGGAELFSRSVSVHGQTSYTINETYTPSVTTVVNATLKVEAKDLAENYAVKNIPIKINP